MESKLCIWGIYLRGCWPRPAKAHGVNNAPARLITRETHKNKEEMMYWPEIAICEHSVLKYSLKY